MQLDRWTAAQWNHYEATGHEPGCPCKAPKPKQPAREEKRVKGSRHNSVLVKRPDVGVTFRSLSDERRYDWLVADDEVAHVDVYPIFSLPGGIRYQADFLVWGHSRWFDDGTGKRVPRVEDVKGTTKLDTAFKRIRALFDASHPLAPLRVVRWDRKAKAWEEM